MKILRIEIDAFGKFNKFHLDLSEGLVIIYGSNEDGKTTLMDFIKLILYSKADNSRSLQNPRRKYIPFSGRPPAGALVVAQNNSQYIIQKSIGESPSKDRVKIINVKTGMEEPFRNMEAGQVLLGLDSEGFEQICFIENVGRMSAPVGFNAEEQSIANITGSGDKRVSRHVIVKRLTDAKELLVSKNGKNGSLIDLREKLQKLKNEKAQVDVVFQKQATLTAEYESLMKLHQEQRKLKSKVEVFSMSDKAAKTEKLLAMIKESSKDHSMLSRPNIPADRMSEYLTRLQQASDEYLSTKKLMEQWTADETGYDGLSIISEDDIRQYEALEQSKVSLEAEINALTQNASAGISQVVLIPIYLLIAAGAILAALFFGPIWLTLLALIPIMFIVSRGSGNSTAKAKRDVYIDQLEDALKQSISILDKYRCRDKAELRERYIAWKAHSKNLETQSRLELKQNTASERFVAIADLYEPTKSPNSAQLLLDKLCAAFASVEKRDVSIHQLTKELGFDSVNPADISARLAGMKIKLTSALSGENPEKMMQLWNSIKDIDYSQQLLELQKRIKTPEKTPDQLIIEIKETSETAEDMANYYKALDIAIAVLHDASDELRSGFSTELNRRASHILGALTDGVYNEMLIAKDYTLSIKDGSMYREFEYFSSGAIDQAYLALRLALSEMTSGSHESYPLLLDDALMQYDDERLTAALKILKKRSGQTILFTCHKHVAEAARSLGTPIISIQTAKKKKTILNAQTSS